MGEVVLPRTLLAVAILLIAGIAFSGIYFYYKNAQSVGTIQTIQDIAGTIGEATGSGSSQSGPVQFSGGSVQAVYENHTLSIYYNLSADIGSLPGIGDVRPVIYEANVLFPLLVIEPGSEVEVYNDTGPILAVASVDSGLGGVDPIAYAFSDGTRIVIVPRLVLLYQVDDYNKVVNITIVVPKINVSCSTGDCSNLQGKYTVRVTAKIVDVLPYPYVSYNPVAEGKTIEASFNRTSSTILPPVCFGSEQVTSVGLEYDVGIDIKYLYYDVYLERVG